MGVSDTDPLRECSTEVSPTGLEGSVERSVERSIEGAGDACTNEAVNAPDSLTESKHAVHEADDKYAALMR